MSEIAAKAVVARDRLRLARIVPYLLLQALIVIGTILGLQLLEPSDPDDFSLSEFSLREAGTTRPVTLPHFTSSRYSLADPPLYSGSFVFKPGAADTTWSVFLPRFSNGAEIAINGVAILDSRRDPNCQPARPQHAGDRSDPAIAAARRQ